MLAFIGLLAIPTSANAVVLVQCEGTSTANYTPGLTNVEQAVSITTDQNYPNCLHLLVPPILMTATSHSDQSRVQQCQTLLGGGPGSTLIQWANGETSTFTWVSNANFVGGNIISMRNGSISAGRYAGHSATSTSVLTPLLGGQPVDFLTGCASPTGVMQMRGPSTFTIL